MYGIIIESSSISIAGDVLLNKQHLVNQTNMTYFITPGTEAIEEKLSSLYRQRGALIRSKNGCEGIVDLHHRVNARHEIQKLMDALDMEEFILNRQLKEVIAAQ